MAIVKPEKWEDIRGYEGLYKVSSHGNIESCRSSKILKPWTTCHGYALVDLYKNGKCLHKPVHRLVSQHFVAGEKPGYQVNHINEIKTDNRAENLEWLTRKQNINHGTGVYRRSQKRRRRVAQIDKDGKIVQVFHGICEVAEKTNLKTNNISACCLGKRKTTNGYRWKYL